MPRGRSTPGRRCGSPSGSCANGYTDFIPDDTQRLVPESIEFSRDTRAWLKERHNQLKPQAVGYRKGRRNDVKGWTVGFALVKPMDETPQSVGR